MGETNPSLHKAHMSTMGRARTLLKLLSNDCWWTGTSIRQIVIRAGGLSGQHKSNTASVIHVRWTHPSGRSYAIMVRDQRS